MKTRTLKKWGLANNRGRLFVEEDEFGPLLFQTKKRAEQECNFTTHLDRYKEVVPIRVILTIELK